MNNDVSMVIKVTRGFGIWLFSFSKNLASLFLGFWSWFEK
jgi:hypothetical protein